MDFGYREFKEIKDFIYEKTGIFIGDDKLPIIKRKIEDILKSNHFADFREMMKHLRYFDKTKKLFDDLISSITVNETYFFREFHQLRTFAEECLPELLERTGQKIVRVLSAGCSIGAEPYTLSIILKEMLDEGFNYFIDAIDIDDEALKKAIIGVYDDRAVKDVPRKYFERYFEIIGPSKYRVVDEIRRNVKFYKMNLMESEKLLELGTNFDFIFCRNVLIYFSDDSRRKVVETFYKMLVPGGYIFLGHSESLSRITNAFELKRMGGNLVYQKPLRTLALKEGMVNVNKNSNS